MKKLEKESAIPLYFQLYSQILEEIRNGTLGPGDMIPPETELMETYGISRATVRHAILDLVSEGYLVRIRSKGTIVREHDYSFGYQRQKHFSAMSEALGSVSLENRVLSSSLVIPPDEVRKALGLADGEEVFYLKRVRSIEGVPSVFVEDWVDQRQCRGIDCINFDKTTLFNTLESIFGLHLEKMVRTFEVYSPCRGEVAREMGLHRDAALLKCTNIVYGNGERPLIYSIALINGKYTVE